MQMPRRFNTYCLNCRGHHEHRVEKARTGRPTRMKWNARQMRRGKATIGNAGKFSKVPGGDKPMRKAHLKYIHPDYGKARMRENWRAGRLESQK